MGRWQMREEGRGKRKAEGNEEEEEEKEEEEEETAACWPSSRTWKSNCSTRRSNSSLELEQQHDMVERQTWR